MNCPANDLGFEPVGYRRWREQLEGILRGEDFEQRLVSRTYDGLRIAPLYPARREATQPWRAQPGRWRVAQRVDHPDFVEARDLALIDLENGADALTLVGSAATSSRGFGLSIQSVADLDRVLAGICLDGIQVRLDAGEDGFDLATLLVSLAERRNHLPGEVAFDFGIDPIGASLTSGWLPRFETPLADVVADFRRRGYEKLILLCDGRPHHEAGAGEAQELAGVLATGLAYLRLLEAAGHDLPSGRDALSFLLVADADQLLTIAKFRALRRLWMRIEGLCGLDQRPIHLHAETSWRMTTKRDPWVNMLRETVAVMSAGIGGADTITALPFTSALGLPDAFARRVVRNTQLVLLEEAHLWRVADPAGGAAGIESLTEGLCDKAWALLRIIERDGGFISSITSGSWQRQIATTRRAREQAAATLSDPIVGTSSFPELSEKPVFVSAPVPPDGAPDRKRRHRGDMLRIDHIPSTRTAQVFENLRSRADRLSSGSVAVPEVLVALWGPRSSCSAHGAFARNLFEAGGLQTREQIVTSPCDLAREFRASGACAVCLCSSDDIYQAPAEDAVKPGETALEELSRTLRRAGCARLYVVGDRDRLAVAARDASVTDVIQKGCDATLVLDAFLRWYEDHLCISGRRDSSLHR